MLRLLTRLLVCLMTFIAMLNVYAQTGSSETSPDAQRPPLLYIIYDSSNSMWGELSDKSRKYEAGRKAIGPALLSNSSQRDLAFRAYGHRSANDCRDSELIVAPMLAKDAKTKIEKAVNSIRPTGKTPISYSLKESLKDFGDRKGDILLISDGIETCDIDPCALMAEWRDKGVKIRIHVVGVGLSEIERKAMMCVAETGGGEYFDAGSEGEFQGALNQVSEIEPGEPAPVKRIQKYGLNIQGLDETGRSFLISGKLYDAEGNELIDLSSNGQHWLESGPGDYVMKVGVRLKDGSIYKPVTQNVTIDTPGSKRVEVLATRPAIVSASFSEDGEQHRGAHVNAFQNGKQVFSFRAHDEALARPGTYEFRSEPNDDNELKVEATLSEGEHTVVDFNLVKTVQFLIEYKLPNGETDQRSGQLFKDDQPLYITYNSNFTTAIPGTYELRDYYPRSQVLNPLPTGIMVTITDKAKQVIEVQMLAGYITTEYVGDERDFVNKKGGYTYIHALDPDGKSIGSKTSSPGQIKFAKPGKYRVLGHSGRGYFDPVEITVEHGKTVKATIVAKPTAHVSMTYASGTYEREPDRASLIPLDGQKPIKTYMGIGKVLKVPPGRYYIKPHSYTPEARDTPEFILKAGESKEIVVPRK